MPELEEPDELEPRPFNAIVEADRFEHFLDTLSTVAREAKVHCTEDGFEARVVDSANVAMVWADLDAEGFESYHGDETTLGVDLERMFEVLDFAGAGDLVHLELDPETRMLDVQINNVGFEIALIDPDAMKAEPDLPDVDLPSSVTIPGSELQKGIDAAEIQSDHLTISVDDAEQEMHITAKGDTDTSDVDYGEEEIIECQVSGPAESMFSVDYAVDLVSPIPDDAEVTIELGTEFPTIWEWVGEEGALDVTMMLAPRIQS